VALAAYPKGVRSENATHRDRVAVTPIAIPAPAAANILSKAKREYRLLCSIKVSELHGSDRVRLLWAERRGNRYEENICKRGWAST
jgi:hypothetical protein